MLGVRVSRTAGNVLVFVSAALHSVTSAALLGGGVSRTAGNVLVLVSAALHSVTSAALLGGGVSRTAGNIQQKVICNISLTVAVHRITKADSYDTHCMF